MRPQWYLGTIGAVSKLIDKRLNEMRAQAIRHLLETEQLAKQLRDRLEDEGNTLVDLVHPLTDLHSHAMNLVGLLDRSMALEEAKGYIT